MIASDRALDTVLEQQRGDKLVTIASRSPQVTEKHKLTSKKELLAIIWATKKFQDHLCGRKFSMCMEHDPLVQLDTAKDNSGKFTNWFLQQQYVPGKKTMVAESHFSYGRMTVSRTIRISNLIKNRRRRTGDAVAKTRQNNVG